MKFRLNSPKFLTFLCYINLRLGKVCLHYKYDKKLLVTGSKNINLPSLVSWAMLHSMRDNKQTRFCYRLYKPKFSNNLGILQFLHHKWKKTYSALQKRDYVANFHSKMRFLITCEEFFLKREKLKKLCEESAALKQITGLSELSSLPLISEPNLIRELLFICLKLSQGNLSWTWILIFIVRVEWDRQMFFLKGVTTNEVIVKWKIKLLQVWCVVHWSP